MYPYEKDFPVRVRKHRTRQIILVFCIKDSVIDATKSPSP